MIKNKKANSPYKKYRKAFSKLFIFWDECTEEHQKEFLWHIMRVFCGWSCHQVIFL